MQALSPQTRWARVKAAVVGSIKKVDVQNGKPVREPTMRQSLAPTGIISVLFFIWGFAYGLLDIMNYRVRKLMGLSRENTALLAAAYYGAYVPGVIGMSGPVVHRWGYRCGFVLGLLFFTIGQFAFMTASGHENFGAMVGSMFVVGLGVSSLERAANPYVVNCGPRKFGTLRILFAQGFAGIGTVVAPLVANKFLKKGGATSEQMSSIIGLFRGVGCITLGLTIVAAIFFFRTSFVPEVPQQIYPKGFSKWKFWIHPLVSMKYSRLWWAAAANFVNLGCQVTVAQFFTEYMIETGQVSEATAYNYLSVAQSLFVVGRYLAAGLVTFPRLIKPRYVLFTFITGAVAITLTCGFVNAPKAAIACGMLIMFWEAPSFPMIFESADADLGEWSSAGETIMIVSICGGAMQPPLFGVLVNHVGISKAWILTACCFGIVWSYCWAINLIPSFKKAVDTVECARKDCAKSEEGSEMNDTENASSRET